MYFAQSRQKCIFCYENQITPSSGSKTTMSSPHARSRVQFPPVSNTLQHLTSPASPSRHQCPDLTAGPALAQTCKACSSCSRLCLNLYSPTGRPLLSPMNLCSNITSTRAVLPPVCVCVHTHAQSSPTLCNPVDCSLSGFFVLGTFQARILEWVAISSSRASS